MSDTQFRTTFMRDHAAVDPLTVPTVPKLLPPLPRISPKKVNLYQVCFQYSVRNKDLKSDKAMICFANMQVDDAAPRKNPFSGLYINYLRGKAVCDDYLRDSQKGIRYPIEHSSSNAQLDVGSSVETLKKSAHKSIFSAALFASDYSDSWKNGEQSRFLRRYFIAAKNGDGLILAKDALENMMNMWNNTD